MNNIVQRCACLSMTLLEDKTIQDANEHVKVLRFVLQLNAKTQKNFMALIGDKYAVNCTISDKMMISFIGCTKHRFPLVVEEINAEGVEALAQDRDLMR